MKTFFTFITLLALLSLAVSFDEDKVTCTDKLNADPKFKEKCIDLYCECMHDCSGGKSQQKVDADGMVIQNNADYSVEECFRNNRCNVKEQMPKLIDCTTCIMERPEETYRCEGVLEKKRKAAEKKRKAEEKKAAAAAEAAAEAKVEEAAEEMTATE